MSTPRVWHVTGANTGFGLQICLKALAEGDKVIAAVRTTSKVPSSLQHNNVKILQFDLSSDQAAQDEYAKEAVAAFGKVDVLVNNAGYGYVGAIEESEYAHHPFIMFLETKRRKKKRS
jgi:NAD(P)-dependent dehydrogenase (short-subunit alcohol dehydrogenase family)